MFAMDDILVRSNDKFVKVNNDVYQIVALQMTKVDDRIHPNLA